MLSDLVLPFRFDAARLKADLARVQAEEWTPHYNDRDYGGVWRGAALRSATGATDHLLAKDPKARPFVDTPLAERCPYFREVMAAFPCPLKSVRLLGLAPRSFIREHSDDALDYEDSEVRIHVPIQTNPGVEFYLSGERLLLEEGGCYYLNVNLPHRVNNRGCSERIHLVIDAEVDGWVRELFERGRAEGWRIPRSAPPEGGIEDFRRLVLADETLQQRLWDIADRQEFCEAAVKIGAELGFDLNEADADAATRHPMKSAPPSPGWTPIRIHFRSAGAFVEWADTGETAPREPFTDETVHACLRRPLTAFLRCEQPLVDTNATPAGFIYHMSRCGSTLAARMLAAVEGIAVFSEVACIDRIVLADLSAPELTPPEQARYLRNLIGAMAHDRCVVKLDAWHIHRLPLIRAAFPDTPWVFVYRDPLEVMVSHLRMPGIQASPGAMDARALGLEAADITRFQRDEWCARVLAGFLRSALKFREDPGALFIDYRELPEAVFDSIAPHFGLTLSAQDREAMWERRGTE